MKYVYLIILLAMLYFLYDISIKIKNIKIKTEYIVKEKTENKTKEENIPVNLIKSLGL